jgi:xanthine dehydrogenase accessory factor
MYDSLRIFGFLADRLQRGEGAALVTVTDVTGASVRNPGAHMAVAADGQFVGSLSGGCIEKAVVAEAQKAIAARRPHCLAYGAGSPIIDIRLPCGGRVDLLFSPVEDAGLVTRLLRHLEARQPLSLILPRGEGMAELSDQGDTGWQEDRFIVRHVPPLRIVIAGHGGSVEALVRQASALDIKCSVFTPDSEIAARLAAGGVAAQMLSSLDADLALPLDRWSALVLFFHDHDWEGVILKRALASDVFFIGAMGSRITHQNRLDALRAMGVDETALGRIVSPIGLIPSSRDPDTLALSTLAQIVDQFNRL